MTAALETLSLGPITLDKPFKPSTTAYEGILPEDVESITFTARKSRYASWGNPEEEYHPTSYAEAIVTAGGRPVITWYDDADGKSYKTATVSITSDIVTTVVIQLYVNVDGAVTTYSVTLRKATE